MIARRYHSFYQPAAQWDGITGSDTSVLLFQNRIYHSFYSCYHTNIHYPSSHPSISVTSSPSLLSENSQVLVTGGHYHNKVVSTPPSQDEIIRSIMAFLTSTSKQRQKQLLSSATGSFAYVTAHKALRSLGLLYGFKVSADDKGDPSIQAIAGLNGPHLRSPMKYLPMSPLSSSVLVLLLPEDVPEDSPFAFGTPFTTEDTTGKAEWIKSFLDEVCHSLFSPYPFQ